jgi:hypothetical protein
MVKAVKLRVELEKKSNLNVEKIGSFKMFKSVKYFNRVISTIIIVLIFCIMAMSIKAELTNKNPNKSNETKHHVRINKIEIWEWDDQFYSRGTNAKVTTVTSKGSNIYIGGKFKVAGNVVTNVAKWDGESWFALGEGTGSEMSDIFDLAVDDIYVYAVCYNQVKMWNGYEWSDLGTPLSGSFHSVALCHNSVYVGANSTITNGNDLYTNGIARWKDGEWASLESGIEGKVFTLTVHENKLYVGGDITAAGDTEVNNIALWDGSTWSSLGNGIEGSIYAMTVDDDDVYVVCSLDPDHWFLGFTIKKWNGTDWISIFDGAVITYPSVNAITVLNGDIYIAGQFRNVGGIPVKYVAKWNGTSWDNLNNGVNGIIYDMTLCDGKIYIGGKFSTKPDGTYIGNISKWDDNIWQPLALEEKGVFKKVNSIACSDNLVYAGGNITLAGNEKVAHIVKWDGNNWSNINGGLNDEVNTILVKGNNDIYAGGRFTASGNTLLNHIANFNGIMWETLNEGLNGTVNTIASNGETIYVGGQFTHTSNYSKELNYIAEWKDGEWSPLNGGVSGNINSTGPEVNAIVVDNFGNVYVGGNFLKAGGHEVNHIAKWDGNDWRPLDNGMNNVVNSIAISNNSIYIGGSFTMGKNSDEILNHVAKWYNERWYPVDEGLDGEVKTIICYDRFIFAGGQFSDKLSVWNGRCWYPVEGGISGNQVSTIVMKDKDLYVGGEFIMAGDKPSFNFGRLAYSKLKVVDVTKPIIYKRIRFPIPYSVRSRDLRDIIIVVYNTHGDIVKVFTDRKKSGLYRIVWDGTDYNGDFVEPGIYSIKIKGANFEGTSGSIMKLNIIPER